MYILISVCVFLSVTTGEVQRDVLPKDPRAIRHRFKNFGPHQFNYKDSDLGNSQTDADSEDYVAPRLVVRRGRKGDNTSSKIPLPGGTYRYRYKNQEKGNAQIFNNGQGDDMYKGKRVLVPLWKWWFRKRWHTNNKKASCLGRCFF
ncbi:hypothetical protein JTE90_011893 [Oedothorax gibbosus]|uniref:Uncharacterized protein n=1 Tax=Oedothorax gibbosus TaxID=931172 RepID=A0AAV6TWZ7_9ARAC|nr:hypothetical protein JTE90_011893 [Oedothorax gibbosus]